MNRALFVMQDLEGGGAERSLLELLRRLDRKRFAIDLFLLRRSGVHLDRVPMDVRLFWGRGTAGRLRWHLPILLWRALALALTADVIVSAMEGPPSYLAWLVARLTGKPLVCWVKTDLDQYLTALPRWHRLLARLIYPRCSVAVVPSTGSLRSLAAVAAGAEPILRVINNPVDLDEVGTMATEPLPDGWADLGVKPFILGAGRLKNDQKGFDLLLKAHASLRARGVDHNLVIVGEGPDRAALEALARELGVASSTFLPGFQNNPFPFFKAARLLAAPARIDGFGRVYLEAMALGLPVVGSRASGPTEILQDGRYGIIVSTDGAEELAGALGRLLTDGELHARYARLSLDRARTFDPRNVAAQWDSLLAALC